ncbi:Hypothetical protein PENO1_109040 [Penicillium occitanis (nom. inval.)]|nr:Hypothetical protein PENO1_109040 [Penicillium occitanis (nom. inval.)]PCG88786.1 hypothetical protein PENOC_109400 [Penicillium occitanis (nom. inval.)]
MLKWTDPNASGTTCNSSAEVASIYLSSKLYCQDKELSTGLKLWKEYCQGISTPLLDLSGISVNATPAYLSSLSTVDPYRNKSISLTSPVLLTRSYYDISFRSNSAFYQALPRSIRIGWSVMGYWGSILVIGMLHRLWTYTRSAHVGSDDAEHGWHSRASPNKRNLASLRHYFNTHLVVPAAVRSYHQRRLWGCSIPNRLELLVVVGFWVMCIILNFGFYDIFTPNTRYDFNATSLSPKLSALTCSLRYQTTAHQVWKYVAQRTSVFAVACLPWVWLFAGRNNIFIWLTGWSFGTFNVFHRHLSRLTVLFAIVHSIAHTVVETVYSSSYQEDIKTLWLKFGIIAVIMMSFLGGLSFPYIRAKFYEAFLIGHITFAFILIIALFKHTAVLGTRFYSYLWPVVAIWSFDRSLRLVRLLYCNLRVSTNRGQRIQTSTAIATYSRDTGVIRLDVTVRGALTPSPGKYFYLYQFSTWRGWENHPFTVGTYTSIPKSLQTPSYSTAVGVSGLSPTLEVPVNNIGSIEQNSISSSSPLGEVKTSTKNTTGLVFWIRPYDGWTRRLQEQCLESSSSKQISSNTYQLRLSLALEGPYGHCLPLHNFDTVVMVIGGTGISTAIPYIHDRISRASLSSSSHYRKNSPISKIMLVWTARNRALIQEICDGQLADALLRGYFEASFYCTESNTIENSTGNIDEEHKQEKMTIHWGRPDVEDIIFSAGKEAQETNTRLAIMACGPAEMADAARRGVHSALKNGCREIWYFEEAYGW